MEADMVAAVSQSERKRTGDMGAGGEEVWSLQSLFVQQGGEPREYNGELLLVGKLYCTTPPAGSWSVNGGPGQGSCCGER